MCHDGSVIIYYPKSPVKKNLQQFSSLNRLNSPHQPRLSPTYRSNIEKSSIDYSTKKKKDVSTNISGIHGSFVFCAYKRVYCRVKKRT